MRTAYLLSLDVRERLSRAGIDATIDHAETLRRAEMTLHRWAEQECGDGNDFASWAIERDETTGKPYRVVYPHNGPSRRALIPDREAGALKRIAAVCREIAGKEGVAVYHYHQTDPRGCALYVSREPLTDQNYNHGVSCAARND